MRSIRASLFSREKLPSESSSSMSSEPSCPNVAEPNDSPLPEVVIAVDFGTTFSGFAYVKTSGPNEVRDNCAWPGSRQVGAETYCKTQTSLYYEHRPSTDGRLHLELKAWGWPAFLAFDRAVSEYVFRHNRLQRQNVSSGTSNSNLSSPITEDPLYASESLAMKVGFFAHRFKLYFAPHHHSISLPALPGNLTPEKLVVDYLRCFTEFIIDRLRVAIREDFSMNEVQWCLTVPAIWDEEAKQLMRTFAEKAGMTKGDLCPNNDEASPYPLRILLEPEAGSVYCQDEASRNLQALRATKFL
ncbi:hypothetical protein KP509_26G016700 [Ceratopteris richardii]|uniref:Uncharacterized protein n=1 Tax=Ceratopteris richardii TaxID=49495 RepID=A0A8T2RIF0_CERRI|nr:hypothetical protein KP509_26G016700 [Ceratopteris richardii]